MLTAVNRIYTRKTYSISDFSPENLTVVRSFTGRITSEKTPFLTRTFVVLSKQQLYWPGLPAGLTRVDDYDTAMA